jgi:hypothetical protein
MSEATKHSPVRWIVYFVLVLLIIAGGWLLTPSGQIFWGNVQEKGLKEVFAADNREEEQQLTAEFQEKKVIVVPQDGHISTLNFSENPLPPGLIEKLPRCKYLNVVMLSGTDIQDDQLRYLNDLQNLTSLTLSSTAVTDAGLKHLEGLSALTALHLVGTKISDAGLESLGKITAMTVLDLSQTEITDEGLKHLQTLDKLKYLLLNGTGVTDEGLKSLEKIPSLARLALSYTKVTKSGVAALKNANPDLTINLQPEKVPTKDKKAAAKTKAKSAGKNPEPETPPPAPDQGPAGENQPGEK